MARIVEGRQTVRMVCRMYGEGGREGGRGGGRLLPHNQMYLLTHPSLPLSLPASLSLHRVKDFFNLGLSLLCVLCAAMASGLTIGLLSLDTLDLEIKQRVGTAEEKQHATALLPLLAHRHLLLVTLLLFNSLAAEALPLSLGELVPGYMAVILSVTAVLFFGVRNSSSSSTFSEDSPFYPSFPPSLPPSLPPCLSLLVPGYMALILSVTAVLFFGVRPSLPPSLPPSFLLRVVCIEGSFFPPSLFPSLPSFLPSSRGLWLYKSSFSPFSSSLPPSLPPSLLFH